MRIETIQVILAQFLRETFDDTKRLPGTRRIMSGGSASNHVDAARTTQRRLARLDQELKLGIAPLSSIIEPDEDADSILPKMQPYLGNIVANKSLDEINKRSMISPGRPWEASQGAEAESNRHNENIFFEGFDSDSQPIYWPEDFRARPFEPTKEDYNLAMLLVSHALTKELIREDAHEGNKSQNGDRTGLAFRVILTLIGTIILVGVLYVAV